MSNFLRNEKGLTLVEMLATISIASMLILMISSTHLFVQNQYNKQTEQIKQLNDMTYVIKLITHDFRRAESENIKVDGNNEHMIVIGENRYEWNKSEEAIKKNDNIVVHQITSFFVREENEEINISIKQANEKEQKFILTRREGE